MDQLTGRELIKISLKVPPPIAVTNPKTAAPNMSILREIPPKMPLTAKTKVPARSTR